MANYVTGVKPVADDLYIIRHTALSAEEVEAALAAKMRVHVHKDFIIPKGMMKIWQTVTPYVFVEFGSTDRVFWLDQYGQWYGTVFVPRHEATKQVIKEYKLEHELQIWPDFMVSLNPHHDGDTDYITLPDGVKLTILVRSRISLEAQASLITSCGSHIKLLFLEWLQCHKVPTPSKIKWDHVFP